MYAENSVTHMISGKAIAMAIRAHILAESALMLLLMQEMKEQSSDIIDFKDLREFYERAYGRKLDEESLKELVLYDSIKQICDEIGLVNSKLKERSRTSKLWLLYMDYNYVAKEFTCAERTSN